MKCAKIKANTFAVLNASLTEDFHGAIRPKQRRNRLWQNFDEQFSVSSAHSAMTLKAEVQRFRAARAGRFKLASLGNLTLGGKSRDKEAALLMPTADLMDVNFFLNIGTVRSGNPMRRPASDESQDVSMKKIFPAEQRLHRERMPDAAMSPDALSCRRHMKRKTDASGKCCCRGRRSDAQPRRGL